MKRILIYMVLLSIFWSSTSLANPRYYPDDVFDDLFLLFDITTAFTQELNLNDHAVLTTNYPGRNLSDFDRNRTGSFDFVGGDALLDLDLAIQQFSHDTVDYDQDGLLGFYELECQNANRPDDFAAVTLRPTLAETIPGLGDGDQDCDGDGISNLDELNHELDPLDHIDGNLDSDEDGIINRDEALIGSNPFDGDSDHDGISDLVEVGDINDPLDEDLDGILDVIDDDCDLVPAEQAPLIDLQNGVCQGERYICDVAQGGWLEPNRNDIEGFEEIESVCDGFDNDCDGQVDELVNELCEVDENAVFAFGTVMSVWTDASNEDYMISGGSLAQSVMFAGNDEYHVRGMMMY